MLVVTLTTAIYIYTSARSDTSKSPNAEGHGGASDIDEVDLWSGDEEDDDPHH